MVKIRFTSTAQRFAEEIVDGNKTVREYLEGKGALMNATFSINGRILSGGELDMPLNDAYANGYVPAGGTIMLYETAKTAGAMQ